MKKSKVRIIVLYGMQSGSLFTMLSPYTIKQLRSKFNRLGAYLLVLGEL